MGSGSLKIALLLV